MPYKIKCEGSNNKEVTYKAIKINKMKDFLIFFTTISGRDIMIPIRRLISIELVEKFYDYDKPEI